MFYSKIIQLVRGPVTTNAPALLLRRNNCNYTSKIVSSGAIRSGDISSRLPLFTSGSSQLNANVAFKLEQPKLQILDRPNDLLNSIIDVPKISTLISYEDLEPTKEISDPDSKPKEEKHAVRMLIIRKRKMRVHKRKKWRKKFKEQIAKIEIRRKIKKEKEFQAELMGKVKEAEKFDPLVYVKEKLAKANKEKIPHRWKGKRLPEFIIKHEQAFAKKYHLNKMAAIERRKNMNTKAADYK
ncbi:hypothetical protein LSTR_LSTR001522 [Laodelphax striatellus]|uniref:Mitochondrial mRNA-processing protein COX24 C-terminal domain-containing protein n=1 Tax=Laodelphax striatellus TaxID=195883 RepID=A0A482XD76_LAOST|nr:hypothetical protein LSTR_LSTR001522 [Laodelphax striatellus]